jgi:DNA sulfur modification protein DndB
LSQMIQRAITPNVEQIATYILEQRELFFNSLVLAVYEGDPQWRGIQFSKEEININNVGILQFSGEEKIFPVDGQHRVEGIKLAITKSENRENLLKQQVPVIFIGHKNTDDGLKRTRRLFSTLNRYAKPVKLNEIIALDEDDSAAIATRFIIENNRLFDGQRLLLHKQKSMPKSNKVAFTNVISLYAMNLALLARYLEGQTIIGENSKELKGTTKLDYFRRFRPKDEELHLVVNFISQFWETMVNESVILNEYLSISINDNPAQRYRNNDGGNLLFRSIGQQPFVECAIKLYAINNSWEDTVNQLNNLPLELNQVPWINVIWNPVNKKMIIRGKDSLIRRIMFYLTDRSLLSEVEIREMIKEYKATKQLNDMGDEDILSEIESSIND